MERTLLINQQLIRIIVTKQQGICAKCQQTTEINLVGESKDQVKEYCQLCSQEFLTRLNNYQFINKELIIKEIKGLLTNFVPKLWADYYVGKKPYCVPCLNSGISEKEYRFCGDNCLVQSWIKYHGHNNLKNKQI